MSTPEKLPATTGARIRAGRKALQLSQRDFGVLVGYGHGYISDIESDRSPASLKFLRQVASKSPLSLRWLKDGQGEMMAERSPITGGITSRAASSAEEYALYCARPDLFPGQQLDAVGNRPPDVRASRGSMRVEDEGRPVFSYAGKRRGGVMWSLPCYEGGVYVDKPDAVNLPSWLIENLPYDPKDMAIVGRGQQTFFVAKDPGRIETGTLYMLVIDNELLPRELHRRPGGLIEAVIPGRDDAHNFKFDLENDDGVSIFGKVIARFTPCW